MSNKEIHNIIIALVERNAKSKPIMHRTFKKDMILKLQWYLFNPFLLAVEHP